MGTDEKLSMYSRRRPNFVKQISRQTINELSLGEIHIELAHYRAPFTDRTMIRIFKQLNMTITHEPSNMAKPDQYFRLYFVDVCVIDSPISYHKSVSIYLFPQRSLESYLIDNIRCNFRSWRTNSFELQLGRLQQLVDLVLSKSSEISDNLLKELIDLNSPIGAHPLIGQSGNIYI